MVMKCECELKKLLNERKMMAQNGPVEKKKPCPPSESPIRPSHVQPHDHILFERVSNFPTNKTIDGNTSIVTCPVVLPEDGQEGENISLDGLACKPNSTGGPLEELLESIKNLKSLMKVSPEFKKKDLTVRHSPLASTRRTLSCRKCLGDRLSTPVLKQNPVDCPFLKIVDMCEATCPCEDIPPIDTGPPCPFAPKPCPCCGAVKCPQSRRPSCIPRVLCVPKIERKPTPPYKCCCPTVTSSCILNIPPPPQCRKHNNVNPAPCPLSPTKCKCFCKCERKESPKCPFVPSLFTDYPLQPAYQCTPCSDIKPSLPKKRQLQSTATMTTDMHTMTSENPNSDKQI